MKPFSMTFAGFLITALMIGGCSVEDSGNDYGDNDAQTKKAEGPSSQASDNSALVDACAGTSDQASDSLVRYTVKRNSKLNARYYDVGEQLSGRFYLSSYVVKEGTCDDTDSTHRLYRDDIKGVWLEISQMKPYDPSFIKTYFVPEEAMSFVDDSMELGLIINPDFIVLDGGYTDGNDYLVRIQVENKTGVVNSSGTWHNDIEAFNVMGFTAGEKPEDTQTDETEQNLPGDDVADL